MNLLYRPKKEKKPQFEQIKIGILFKKTCIKLEQKIKIENSI